MRSRSLFYRIFLTQTGIHFALCSHGSEHDREIRSCNAQSVPQQPFKTSLEDVPILTTGCESAGSAFRAALPGKSYPSLSTGTFDTESDIPYMFVICS